jgi:hypothetical protein
MAPDTDAHPNVNDGSGGAFNEPLVLDFATMQDASDFNTTSAPLSPATRPANSERRESWLWDDDTSAPAPQIDFTRKDIHIPSRTRYFRPFSPAFVPFVHPQTVPALLGPTKSVYHCKDD